jgi:hypothetical protein
MPADQQVHVVSHDGTAVASAMVLANRRAEAVAEEFDLLVSEREAVVEQIRLRLLLELTNDAARGLHLLAAAIQFTQVVEVRYANH